jgi:hypothetical protein
MKTEKVTLPLSNEALSVFALKQTHLETWRDRSQLKWTLGLLEEVVELLLSLVGLHKGPPGWELQQIASIAMNWLEVRAERREAAK